ncbi:extracellular solute-binding protein [Paenibacillus sp. CF384]|uniref:extracellular solute-binding protein n=1 Tax=Paenibacillus sp. CF384 TaxID=1884382 RepID=UPI00089BC15B|nr:extracellular solute-binding protein [Paenibacillus sp. CF384]SDW25097.1 carbohydrate ABC transporter substrate-binding protein, CUT1 family [Paenibacillus sp. CF384]
MKGTVRKKKLTVWSIGIIGAVGLIVLWTQLGADDVSGAGGKSTFVSGSWTSLQQEREDYTSYLAKNENAGFPDREVIINASDYDKVDGDDFEKLDNYEGMKGTSLMSGEQGRVDWTVSVPEAGFYNMSVQYYPIKGKSSSIERSLLIDGALPFEEAGYLQFDRIWDNQLDQVKRDNRGNDLRPQQFERPEWREVLLKDSNGYYADPFRFYLTAGTHTLSFVSQREPMVIRQLRLYQDKHPALYEETVKRYEQEGLKETDGQLITVQAENARAKSSPTLYPQTERASAAVKPYSPELVRVNTIGGYNWRMPGQWIEWEVDAPEAGLYKIAMKTKQQFVRGIYSTRTLYVNGEVPFREAEQIPFRYKSGYRVDVMGGDEPYLFELKKGKNIIRLEDTLGEFAPLIREVKDSLFNLNAMYRKVIMITGASPDKFRDYRVDEQVPNLLKTFKQEEERLTAVSKELKRLSGGSSDSEALLKTMALQLGELIDEPDTIPRRLAAYKSNTGGLGTWLQKALEMPLQIDEIYVASPNKKLPSAGDGFFTRLSHEIMTFAYSFYIDYNQIGNASDEKNPRSITVWIGSGRDQANTLKAMIDETFTPQTGINVNLKLVQMSTLLPATLAGQGPDVAMQISNDIPVNYAMRKAAADLSQFPDYKEVADWFRPSALVPFTYQKGVYALPETQTFNMLFYRKDVLNELGLEVPQTWDDMYKLLAVLNKNRMQLGMPITTPPTSVPIPGQNIPPNAIFATMLMQNGGQFYRNDGKESDLDSKIGVETFKTWTDLYSDYKLEREFDFANRFRTGEMPIGIVDYTTYNQLSVFAPEIRGMWGFVPIPGTKQPDGTIRRDTPSNGSGTLMLNAAKDKDAAWQFMKWWTGEEAQTKYGREMEALMGASARYPTANVKALDSLPWPVADYDSLKEEFEWVRGIPEVPGGYFTGRHLQNAFLKVVVGADTEAREAILDYAQYIQDEIRAKRKEFGLPE